MVSKASEDLPDPDRPVMTTSASRGIDTVTFLRLCSRAPETMSASDRAIETSVWKRTDVRSPWNPLRAHFVTNLLSGFTKAWRGYLRSRHAPLPRPCRGG